MQWLKDALKDIYDKIVSTLNEWIKGFWDLLEWVVTSICDFFQSLFDHALELAKEFGEWLYDLFLGENGFVWYLFDRCIEWGTWFIENVLPDLGQLLQQYQDDFGTAMGLIGRLNAFFPISESAVLLTSFLGFMSLYLMSKFMFKLFRGA